MSYLSVEELKDLVQQLHTSTERDSIKWDTLSDQDILVYYGRVITYLHSLRYVGKTVEDFQELKFPRYIDGSITPSKPKEFLECIARLVFLFIEESQSTRVQMVQKGVTALSTPHVKESFDVNLVLGRREEVVNGTISHYILGQDAYFI